MFRKPSCQDAASCLHILLLLLTLPGSVHTQIIEPEGSGTTEEPFLTTPAPEAINVPAQFGLTSGDVQRTVSADVETVIPMSLEPFSLVANGVQEPVLYMSSNGAIANFPVVTGSIRSCSGTSFLAAGLWYDYQISPTEESLLFARVSRIMDNSPAAQADRDLAFRLGLVNSPQDLAFMVVSTNILQTINGPTAFQTLITADLVTFTFKMNVFYSSVSIDPSQQVFIGYCQGGNQMQLALSGSLFALALAPASFTFTLPFDNSQASAALQLFHQSRFSCVRWLSSQAALPQFQTCPCNAFQAIFATSFTGLTLEFTQNTIILCAIGRQLEGSDILNLRCCYDTPTFLPFFFALQLNPAISAVFLTQTDLAMRDVCARGGYLGPYLEIRPLPSCANYSPPSIAWLFGDPHITSLDGTAFTCNPIGYLLLFDSSVGARCDVKFEQTGSNNLVGSVAKGIACRDAMTGTVTFDIDDATNAFTLLIEDTDITNMLTMASPMFMANGITVMRNYTMMENGAVMLPDYLVRFTAGNIILRVIIDSNDGMDFLRYTLSVGNAPMTTNGLLGTFNGDPSDDFLTRDGTTMSPDSSEEDIYNLFCVPYTLTMLETIFRTPIKDFIAERMSYSPTICENLQVSAEVEQACGTNAQCRCDAGITGSMSFAMNTLSASDDFAETQETISNSPPTIEGPSRILVTVGMEYTTLITAADPDNHAVTLGVVNLPSGATYVNGVFTWTPQDRTAVDSLNFTATDSTGREATPIALTVILCDCSGRGTCQFNQLLDGFVESNRFQLVQCLCPVEWIGDHCEMDIDACCPTCPNTCLDTASCIDLDPAEQQLLGGRAFNCSACPAGFDLEEGRCVDVNECDTLSPCDQECTNIPGSFSCTCNSGYLMTGATTCADIDECALQTDNCTHICSNTDGSFQCSCFPGYTFVDGLCDEDAETMTLCEDDPCDTMTTICAVESSMVSCTCRPGYMTDTNTTCQGINECDDGSHQCRPVSTCVDQTPGYTCTCSAGSVLAADMRGCDACQTGMFGVDCTSVCNCRELTTVCDPVTGCAACRDGFMGSSCNQNINECNSSPCPANSMCNDTVGSFICPCNAGYEMNPDGSCTAINRCLESPCEFGTCVQMETTFRCDCMTGYAGATCSEDINECDIVNLCMNGATCNNLIGTISCTCTAEYMGTTCSQPVPTAMNGTTTIAPATRVITGSLTLTSPIPADMQSEAYANYTAALAQAIRAAILGTTGNNAEVTITQINPATGMVNYNIAVPFASSVTAAQLSAAILRTLNANGSLRAAGMVFTVNPATILVGGVPPSTSTPTRSSSVLAVALGASLGVVFLILMTILITYFSKRVFAASSRRPLVPTYGRPPGPTRFPLRRGLQWLPSGLVSSRVLSNLNPRARPPNNPWAIDIHEPEVQQPAYAWRGGDNAYYSRALTGPSPAVVAANAIAAAGPAPVGLPRPRLLFRKIPFLSPTRGQPPPPAPRQTSQGIYSLPRPVASSGMPMRWTRRYNGPPQPPTAYSWQPTSY